MAFNFRKFFAGLNIVPKSVSTVDSMGDMDVTSGDGKLNYHNGTTSSPMLTESQPAAITNKVIDANLNTILNSIVADNSINEDKLTTSVAGAGLTGGDGAPLSVVVDNASLEISSDTVRVKDLGITTAKINNAAVDETKLAASVAGAGLAGGAGSALSVNVDNSTTQISGDTVVVKDGLILKQNFLLNSNFDFWQRGTSLTIANAASTYVPDRWYVKNSLGTNGIITASQQTGSSDGAKFAAKLLITTAPTAAQANGTELYQTLENLQSLSLYNQQACFSIKVKAFGNVNQCGIQFFYKTTEAKVDTAIGSEVTATVNTAGFTTITISGQALGTAQTAAGVVGVRIRIAGVSAGNTYDLNNGFSVEQAMLNLGTVSSSYRRQCDNMQEELSSCERFAEKSYEITIAPGTAVGTGSFEWLRTGAGIRYFIWYKTRKRTPPINTLYNPVTGAANSYRDLSASVNRAPGSLVVSSTTFYLDENSVGWVSLGVNNAAAFQWFADAEI